MPLLISLSASLLVGGLAQAATPADRAVTQRPGSDAPARLDRLQAQLTRQDYAAARAGMQALLKQPRSSNAERALIYQWLLAHDDLAELDRRSRAALASGQALPADRLAAARLALDTRDFERARQGFAEALAAATRPEDQAQAQRGLGQVAYQLRDFDGSLQALQAGLAVARTADGLVALADTLIRLGRTDEAITAAEQALALNPYNEAAHYLLGNGYTRRNYSQLEAELGAGYAALMAQVREASDAFEREDFDRALSLSLAVLQRCPGLGRAHAIAAKALESQRFRVDVHRADYERRFAAQAMPEVPGIERYVLNWKELSPRHRKRVALSVAPWKAFIPVLVEGGATLYIKPLSMKLSETPQAQSLRDQRIDYDSRLWDDVRGMGGHFTVTGIEDVERTIFDKYNTVLHELTHQVHGVLTADQSREIQELYRQAKSRDEATRQGFLSRYAGGSVWEYFAEGANAEASPRRDAYDGREIVRERLIEMDPALRALIQKFYAMRDTRASLPIAFVNAGNQRLEDGQPEPALAYFKRAQAVAPDDERVLAALLYALAIQGDGEGAQKLAARAIERHPGSGALRTAAADALWHSGQRLQQDVVPALAAGRGQLRGEDRFRVDLALGDYYRKLGQVPQALAAYEAVLAYQGDQPEALWGRAATLALDGRWDAAFTQYEQVLRLRTGLLPLRRDLILDLLRAGRIEPARAQIRETLLLDPRDPDTLALQAWLLLKDGDAAGAQVQAAEALKLGPWSDLAQIIQAAALQAQGQTEAARAAIAPLKSRAAEGLSPAYVYRADKSGWLSVHERPAAERQVLELLLPGL